MGSETPLRPYVPDNRDHDVIWYSAIRLLPHRPIPLRSGTTQLGCGFLETSFGCTQSPRRYPLRPGVLSARKTPPRFGGRRGFSGGRLPQGLPATRDPDHPSLNALAGGGRRTDNRPQRYTEGA
jgi:hypothetical protein